MFRAAGLEFLSLQQRVKKISEDEQRRDSGNDVVHGVLVSLLQPVAELGKGPASGKEYKPDQEIEQISHKCLLLRESA